MTAGDDCNLRAFGHRFQINFDAARAERFAVGNVVLSIAGGGEMRPGQ